MTQTNERAQRRRNKPGVKSRLVQAFKQAPWRLEIQSIGLFLLALITVLLVASIYLSISGRAAAAGLRAYQMNLERQDLERQISDQKAQIAVLTSSSIMEERAAGMGFERIDPADVIYVPIDGYPGKQSVVLAPPPGITQSGGPVIKSIYRQSLWDWLFSGITRLSDSVNGAAQ
jgi:cell division protein FtsL